jgi:hypothetical protein
LTFQAYVRQFLLPTLKPGDVVVMDNLKAATKAKRSARLFAASARSSSSCRRTRPTSNPVEWVFFRATLIGYSNLPALRGTCEQGIDSASASASTRGGR